MAKEILGGNSKKFDEDIAKEDCQKIQKNFATQIKTSWNNPNKLFIDALWTQTQGLCQRVVGHSKYSGSHYSYGNKYIYDCANGSANTGNAERWRKVGTNHHLT
ncbi:hypothetical protein [Paenibacillus sp. FSL L8-0158]|uniref:beta family protein n=1 Tax=Paenibacillus sp. FSL L8-0158 TaxID=2954752 RepID=UPI003157F611